MDIALYRASEAIGGRVDRMIGRDSEGRLLVELVLQRNVTVILSVTVNGIPSPSIEIYGERRVLVTVPLQLAQVALRNLLFVVIAEVDFELINETPVPTTIGIGLRPSTFSGPSEALQTAVRSLYMDPGSDIWNRERGGGLRSLRNQLVGRNDESRFAQIVQVAIDRYNANVSKLRTFGRSRTSVTRTLTQYRVSRIQLQSVRILSYARTQAEYGYLPAIGSTKQDVFRDVDSDAPVIVVNLLMTVQGPQGTVEQVSSSLTA